jgi:hypothetical protein
LLDCRLNPARYGTEIGIAGDVERDIETALPVLDV